MDLPEEIISRMKGKSMPDGALVGFDELSYLRLIHCDGNGLILKGEMVVSKQIAAEVAEIFLALYQAGYPIERIRLIDDYDAVDENSMRDNNSSSFCYRTILGSTKLSKHSLGLAVDINPLYNPYFKFSFDEDKNVTGWYALQPETAGPYVDRTGDFQYKMGIDDLAVRLFKEKGYEWGGDWTSCKDYQHFEKIL
ncbi:MAG: M15 family metallopeptidase [Bacteroidales bacterium]|nr:M15 family metallopeptidase [Bacteroidales bacterium]